MILPVAEIRNEILANLAGGIFAGVGVEALPVAQGFKRRQPDGEQDSPLVVRKRYILMFAEVKEAIPADFGIAQRTRRPIPPRSLRKLSSRAS
jgi:hypothetical protein